MKIDIKTMISAKIIATKIFVDLFQRVIKPFILFIICDTIFIIRKSISLKGKL